MARGFKIQIDSIGLRSLSKLCRLQRVSARIDIFSRIWNGGWIPSLSRDPILDVSTFQRDGGGRESDARVWQDLEKLPFADMT